jgi:hypothetical protein
MTQRYLYQTLPAAAKGASGILEIADALAALVNRPENVV